MPRRPRAGSPSATPSPAAAWRRARRSGDRRRLAFRRNAAGSRRRRLGHARGVFAATPAAAPSLTLRDADTALGEVAGTAGRARPPRAARAASALRARHRCRAGLPGPPARRRAARGALEGAMLDAIAAASGLPAADVRRAAMVTGSLRETARVAMRRDEGEGAAGLARFAVALLRPVQPMLATPADDIAGAMAPARSGGARMEGRRRARPGAQGAARRRQRGEGLMRTPQGRDRPRPPEIVEDPPGAARARASSSTAKPWHSPAGGAPPALPGDHATLRSQARRAGDAPQLRPGRLLRLPAPSTARSLLDLPAQERFDRARRRATAASCVIPRIVTADIAAARGLLRRRARARTRGRDGQGARCALRGGPRAARAGSR